MTVIGIDTAGRLGGVAIVSDGRLLGSKTLGVEEGHSQNLLPSLEGLMEDLSLGAGDIGGIAVAIGPDRIRDSESAWRWPKASATPGACRSAG